MAHGISRAKRPSRRVRFNQPGDVATVLRVLYLVFKRGYSGDVDLAARRSGSLASWRRRPTMRRSPACWRSCSSTTHGARPEPPPKAGWCLWSQQDRSLWDHRLIAEGVDVLQAALTSDRLGEFQAQAAIAALHADAGTIEETDWVQDRRVVRRTGASHRQPGGPSQPGRRSRARPMARGPAWPPWRSSMPPCPATTAVAAYLRERGGRTQSTAARLYVEAARSASNLPERDHLTRQAARLNVSLRS